MTTVNYSRVQLKGTFEVEHIERMEVHVKANAHGYALIEGEVRKNTWEQLKGAVAGREQEIVILEESGEEKSLFSGVMQTAQLITFGEYYRIRIELASGSILMDQKKRNRSFQNVGQTYSQIAEQVTGAYTSGAAICSVGEQQTIEKPVIQYRETDWEFLLRMASDCGGVIVPETSRGLPRIWFGFPSRSYDCTFSEDQYTSGISPRYYELGGPISGYSKADFLYYDVKSTQLCEIGWYTKFQDQSFQIAEKHGIMERGELIFTYRLGRPGLGWGKKQYNLKISGMTLLGEVIETTKDVVKIKLDIDEGWDPGGPYSYDWRPETGNMMYCMPQVGTRISLYFPNYDEKAAMAINCVQTNGESCARMSNPAKRSFVSEHGKELNLYPDQMGFVGGAKGNILLSDQAGISLSTNKKVEILAKSVIINGKSVAFSAPSKEITIIKQNVLNGSVQSSLLQSEQYDILSKIFTHLTGSILNSFPPYEEVGKEVESTEFNWLELNFFAIL